MIPNRSDVFGKVQDVLAKALCVDPVDITEQTLLGGLGLDPVDLLDILFRLSKEFGLKEDQIVDEHEIKTLKHNPTLGRSVSVGNIVDRIIQPHTTLQFQ